ncbi:adenosine kinase [Candidatus Latescibacterota bacterium]
MQEKIQVIGVGSPIIDLIARIDDSVLHEISGEKGGMELIDDEKMGSILELLSDEPVKTPGGSAGNTTFALAQLGFSCAFLGKLGDDSNGAYYRTSFKQSGGDSSRFKTDTGLPSASCISLVTPDGERTMRTHLGAAMTLAPEEITADDFKGCGHAHIEGYLLFNRELLFAVLSAAKEGGCTVSLDLGSFEVVNAASDILPDLLDRYVDIIFANEDETESFCGDCDPQVGLERLSEHCECTAVKIGKDGAWIKSGGDVVHTSAISVESVIDTTGAGDFWAAGFLYGYLNGRSPSVCGKFGSILGGNVVQYPGTSLPNDVWDCIREEIALVQ